MPKILNGTPASPAVGNWYQQFMPNPAGGQIRDVYFIDSLTGFAVSDSCILKTTTSGDSWTIKLTGYYIFNRIKFINNTTGFASGGNNTLLKTNNSGENWTPIILPSIYPFDMSVVSNDSIWLVNSNSLTGGVFRTTNGGGSWEQQLNIGSLNPNHVYFYNGRLGFICEDNMYLRRTSDGGAIWQVISGAGGFLDMHFADSLTGWKTSFQKTTDGGLNWINQILPSGGMIHSNLITNSSNVNRDTIWANGGYVLFPNNQVRSILNRSTNGGVNWLFQIPDTSTINNIVFYYVNFINKNNGWATDNQSLRGEIHTNSGGDTVFYTGLIKISENIPIEYMLFQNFPNPFNPRTIIRYNIKTESYVKLIVFDITGKEIQVLQDVLQTAGSYETDFMGKFLSSGVYFYRLEVINTKSKIVYLETKKMLLIK